MADPKSLAGKKVLVTGGAGFVGSHVVDLLARCDCAEIVVIDNFIRGRVENLESARRHGMVRVVDGDIRDSERLASLLDGVDTVFHQAALRITHCAAEPRQAFEVMAAATFNLFEACVRKQVGKIVFASSASIYGMADAFPTPEFQSPYANRTLYGAAKSFGEGLLRALNDMHGLDYIALRYFNVYGPRMDLHGRYTEVLIRWMERIAGGEPPTIFGDGTQSMDFVHVMDVARANLLAALCDETDLTLNVGSGVETTLVELALALAAAMGRPALTPLHVGDNPVNPVRRRLADTSAARRALQFEATMTLHDGLRELVGWWQLERNAVLASATA